MPSLMVLLLVLLLCRGCCGCLLMLLCFCCWQRAVAIYIYVCMYEQQLHQWLPLSARYYSNLTHINKWKNTKSGRTSLDFFFLASIFLGFKSHSEAVCVVYVTTRWSRGQSNWTTHFFLSSSNSLNPATRWYNSTNAGINMDFHSSFCLVCFKE